MDNTEVQSLVGELPEWVQRFNANRRPVKLEELLPGETNARARAQIASKGYYEYSRNRAKQRIGVFTRDGYVMAVAATVNRDAGRSYDYIREVRDFERAQDDRAQKIPLLYRIYGNAGLINNGINKTAGLVSHEGTFYIKHAKQGKKRQSTVKNELFRALDYWKTHINARAADMPITGARGLSAIMDQGTRMALIEGSYIGYAHEQTVKIPTLDKTWKLPMFMQTISTQYIEIPDWSAGTGLEVFYFKPPRQFIQRLRANKAPEEKAIIEKAFSPEFMQALERDGRALLESPRIVHVKHRGTENEAFGESYIEPMFADLAYMKALQQLDFVTIDSLINRIVIIKVGSDDPDSDYHNPETAQFRVKALESIMEDPGPNMTVVWAGPDIDVIQVSAHDAILNIDERHKIAVERNLLSMGMPRAILDGTTSGGQVWAGYEGAREALRSMVNNWSQAWVSLAERIALQNGYDEVEIVYTPNRAMLADQTANADLAIKAYSLGAMSARRLIGELGGDFDAERRNKILELGLDPDVPDEQLPPDTQIFAPPTGLPGQTTSPEGDVERPGGEPGRPRDTERVNLEPERPPEDRRPNDGE